ncbi:hypothetical protein HPB48_017877 [Haemaphysalis longicornis]|uniref:Immunoglobulin V-set domain-containing protein n=1 Tax=Haemaphysalis longicornis TaxID=44386 RepID=A0A9J6GMH6_HAELO|nr:hypothetical protein HPB48_017877 [Haemaphysalis longicornis]
MTTVVSGLDDGQLARRIKPAAPAWIKVEDKGILSIHQQVISRNYRISLSTSDNRHFVLHIRNVQESDRGGYMCQINTSPMMSQVGYLDVLGEFDACTNGSSMTMYNHSSHFPLRGVGKKSEAAYTCSFLGPTTL